jgi:Opioid growth factor receptor (OGFr) conserved region
MRDSPLVAFYRGEGRDHRGRLLSHIHQYAFDDLERHHDYIQWLFPLPEPSGANASAPLLSQDDIAAFEREEPLRNTLLKSFQLMLQFYGLELAGAGTGIGVRRSSSFDDRSRVWVTSGNHNFLRISRILRSLSLLGHGKYASALLECLEGIYEERSRIIGTTTLEYWRRAIA